MTRSPIPLPNIKPLFACLAPLTRPRAFVALKRFSGVNFILPMSRTSLNSF